MKQPDWSVPAIIFEAVDIILGIAYIVLQVYYGVIYHVAAYRIGMNIAVAVLLYAGLTALAIWPERINGLSREVCVGSVRKLSIRMVRIEKCVFLLSLIIPCVCDVVGIHLRNLYDVAVILVILAIAIFYEVRIVQILRKK